MSRLKKVEVKNPVTGEIITQFRRTPRVYADLDYVNTEVQQSFKKECDINNILKRYTEKGVLPDLIKREPRFGDFSDVPSYQDSLHRVIFAQQQFDALSAETRKRFGNDPAEFLAFANDPANAAELVKLGLATERKPDPIPEPQKVIIVNSDDSKGDPIPPKSKPTK